MKDPWFRWERESAIHLLYPTLEGSMKTLQDFCGYSYPLTILIFKNGIVTWCMKEKEFYDLGAKLLKLYGKEPKEKKLMRAVEKRLKVLQKAEEKVSRSVKDLTNDSLADLYQKLHDAFVAYYTLGAIIEPLAMQAERQLKGVRHEVVPSKISFVQEAENYLLDTKDIEGFINKYFWIENSYARTKVLTKEDVENRLKNIKQVKAPKISQGSQGFIRILNNFATYQDERKRNILIYLHYLEILLKEIGKRGNIDLELMRDIFPEEIKDILKGKISKKFIKNRREKCFVVWEEGKSKPEILTGDKTKKWEQILAIKHDSVKVVKGNCASKGQVRGKVRVLLAAADHDKLEKGEVLVTFMTSPDFMSAIRKCSAIVTNLGGITSHAAIISRELKIPCVVGTKNATEVLKTGDFVEVNADKGEITTLS
ncbi:hypothetical protein KKE03_04000 [Patescibacteria group bacterium]|nr:hypothetical protein [Patescibacteria group bacterium]